MGTDKHTVDGSTHEWDEGDIAVVLRFLSAASGPRWAVVEMKATRGQDGILRWHDGRFLHQGVGIQYREACQLCVEHAEKIGGKVPAYKPRKDESKQDKPMYLGKQPTLVGQWRNRDFVNNRKNRILRTLKEDL